MNYLQFVNNVLETAKSHKLVYEVGEGDIYEHLNSGDHKYPCVFLTVQNIDSNGSQMTVTGSIFYVDTLLSDSSNKLQIQATGMTILQQIFMRLMDNYPDFDLRTGRYTPFDEKFADLCAGVFSNFTVSFMDDICIVNDDIFEGDEPITPEPEGKYLTITVLDGTEGTTIAPTVTGNLPNFNLQYRINSNGAWTDFIVGTTEDIHLVAGDFVQFKGNNPNGVSIDLNNYLNFDIPNEVHLSGNVMSLIDDVGDTKVIPRSYCFNYLFKNTKIKTVAEDLLPATTLTDSCYYQMFIGCTALTTAPALPANTLADSCYDGMFYGCTSLTTAPELPATTLTTSCYYRMFHGCTSLVTAPELPATTLADSCYGNMFAGCTALTTAPALPATMLADNCYSSMFHSCTALTTAPVLPATTLAEGCYGYMFSQCRALETAPALPATTLANNCYEFMLYGCTSLVNAPVLPATTLADSCYKFMFYNCTALVNAPELPATTLAVDCYTSMFYYCTALVNAPELPATTLSNRCYENMFYYCTSLVNAPVLPATTLSNSCYSGMFYNCNNMNYVKCLATDISASRALNNWLSGVAPTGTFVKKYGVEYLINSPSGIPDGWTVEEIDVPIPPEPEGKYMTITALDGDTGTTIKPTVDGNLPNLNLQYRINNGDWTDFVFGTTADIHVVSGDFVQWKGNNPNGVSDSGYDNLSFAISGNPVSLSGNVMSLIDGVGDTLIIPSDYCFCYLFSHSNVKTVSQDFLPATELKTWCYSCMFDECHSLLQCPELPATKLEYACYRHMFNGCHSLLQCPELPATELALECYEWMFAECISLATAPVLPATTLATGCYGGMFAGCTSLTTAPELRATKLASYCYNEMFHYCRNLTHSPELPATVLAANCYQSMFAGCTSLVNAPELPATVLAESCYNGMFSDCKSLKQAPKLPATKLASYCYKGMFQYCRNLVTPPELPVINLESYCYYGMFYGCTSLTTAPALPATTLAEGCYKNMFNGCTALTTAPELPANTLTDSCYKNMFNGCTSLNYVKCHATEITANDSLTDWLSGVASTGTFVKKYGVEYLINSPSGIPQGWTVEEIDAPIQEPKYMTITVDDNAGTTTIKPTVKGSLTNLNLQYRINNGNWNDYVFGQTGYINVVAGDVVQFKGVNESGLSIDTENYLNFDISDSVHLSGNVMSLIDGVGDTLVIPNNYCFYNLFSRSKIKTVSADFLPATEITSYCYFGMFEYCRNLLSVPELPATTTENRCYFNMFYNCSSLVQAPALPATTLAEWCYTYMFSGCTSLVKAPELPATTLVYYCYDRMFEGCTSLVQAPALHANTLANSCYSGMFKGCTSLVKAPELPATTLVNKCYYNMFFGCSSLNYVKSLATNITEKDSLLNWLYGVASTGTFVKPAGVSYETGDSGIPGGWTIQNI